MMLPAVSVSTSLVGSSASTTAAPSTTTPAASDATGAPAVAEGLRDLDTFPAPEDGPDFYVDYDETSPYEVAVGDSECAT